MFLHDYILACEISTVRTKTIREVPVYSINIIDIIQDIVNIYIF